ncbi:tRNA dihydrouridine synthase DusB [Saccharobesus litoralis]|uniref:tRNA-dihydrouridine synthase B n=1 Tax=Saccharobesus litoralis TaxID=2172099 RepID=A0A2S0VRJ5_9ALTE|nr:tRNA dihydrouridine synthase DusB [Saccharobesus litoralis]AWB66710.1 tRNA dihydrouridine synthase DusB [Saccharobesus litoralis]
MQIASYTLKAPVILAPMAGITDKPYRQLCRKNGCSLAYGEMLSSNPDVWQTAKSQKRMETSGETGIQAVQIVGCDPDLMAQAAQFNAETGAQIIDINMGCPAKKVNKKLAGSALLKDPALVERILKAVTNAVDVPVTLKIRTGWDPDNRNGIEIAQLAEKCGIQSLAVHGRTRACLFKGEAEYDTIKAIKQAVSLPVVANGDITSAEKAKYVLDYTGADAVMIGRGSQGNPWIFADINHYLLTGEHLPKPDRQEIRDTVIHHVAELHELYGEGKGLRIARKHVSWYFAAHSLNSEYRKTFNAIENAQQQLDSLQQFFDH